MNFDITNIIVALVAGLGVKIYEDFVASRRKAQEEAKKSSDAQILDNEKLRAEIWARTRELEKQIERNSNELSQWKEKYSGLQTEYLLLKNQHESLKIQYSELLSKYDALQEIVKELTEKLAKTEIYSNTHGLIGKSGNE